MIDQLIQTCADLCSCISQVLQLLLGRIAAVCIVVATLRALVCLQGTRGAGSISSCSHDHENQEDKEAEAVSVRTRAQTRAQTSKAVMQQLQVAYSVNHAVQRML